MPSGPSRPRFCPAVLAAVVAAAASAAPAAGGQAGVVINEFWTHDAAVPPAEYVELYSAAGVNLAGLSLIAVDGNNRNRPDSSAYRRLALRLDFTAGDAIEPGGYLLVGGNLPAAIVPDFACPAGSLPNGSMTLAIVRTQDIETCEDGAGCAQTDPTELTEASLAALAANLIDAIAVMDDDAADPVYFNAPALAPNPGGNCWDAGARLPNGVDTDSPDDWATQDNFTLTLGSAEDHLSTPGFSNQVGGGACCLPGGACQTLTGPDCVGRGGTYAGDGSLCENVICATGTAPAGCMCDVDGQEGTTVFDLLAFLDCWFEGCP